MSVPAGQRTSDKKMVNNSLHAETVSRAFQKWLKIPFLPPLFIGIQPPLRLESLWVVVYILVFEQQDVRHANGCPMRDCVFPVNERLIGRDTRQPGRYPIRKADALHGDSCEIRQVFELLPRCGRVGIWLNGFDLVAESLGHAWVFGQVKGCDAEGVGRRLCARGHKGSDLI